MLNTRRIYNLKKNKTQRKKTCFKHTKQNIASGYIEHRTDIKKDADQDAKTVRVQ